MWHYRLTGGDWEFGLLLRIMLTDKQSMKRARSSQLLGSTSVSSPHTVMSGMTSISIYTIIQASFVADPTLLEVYSVILTKQT